jgi:hypothetical protein
MQPCEVCGGMGIDANGYCTQCRTYRGIPGQAAGPGSPAPYGAGYPQSPAYPPTGGYPPQQPGYQQPAYGQQTGYQQTGYGQQQPGYGQPTYAAPVPTPPKQRSSYTIPLIALSATLVVVVVGIVAIVLFRDGDTPDNPSAIDNCVVGTWEVTDYTEDVAVPEVGKVTFTDSGKGATLRFTKDGKGVQDFGTGTVFTGTVQGAKVNLEISGTVRYDFRTNDNTMSFSNLVSDGKAKVSVPSLGREESQDFTGSDDPSRYTCGGDKMTMSTSLYRADLKRTSATA